MALKFRNKYKNKKYYKIIITILICLLLAFLYLGNYNLRESLENKDISGNSNAAATYKEKRAKKAKEANLAISATGGNDGSDGYKAQMQAFTLAQNLEDKNTHT